MPSSPEKHREITKERNRRNRENYFLNKFCARCGSFSNLELDHINPEEKETHRIWSWSEERRLVELAKCQVLCNSCHKNKTSLQKKDPKFTGCTDRKTYTALCKCEKCRKSQRERKAEWRKRTGKH